MELVRALAGAVTIVLALAFAGTIWSSREQDRAMNDCGSYTTFAPRLPSGWRVEWKWRELEYECVFEDYRTGRRARVDIDDARAELARH